MSQVILPPWVAVMPPSGATPVALYLSNVTGITTEALATLTIQRGDAGSTTGSTYAPTTGKTFRLMSATFSGVSSSTALLIARLRVRGLSSGTATVTSPVRIPVELTIPAATAANGTGFSPIMMSAGAGGMLDVPSGGTLGLSHSSAATTYTIDAALIGYEF